MPAAKNSSKRRRVRRRRRLLLLLAVVLAAVGVVAALMHWGNRNQLLSDRDTAAPSPQTSGEPAATGSSTGTAATGGNEKRYVDGHYIQTGEAPWNLRLVNPWNPLPEDWDYEANLADYNASQQFDARATDALRQMIAAGRDYDLSAASLYRSYDLQTSLFNRQVSAMQAQGYTGAAAEEKAATVVARPGTSEHHMGLAADILGSGYTSLEESFDTTPAYAWLKENCAEYGFILRYPKEKEDVTGVIYEPWHYRYVGVDTAREIMSRGLTLEEYLEERG